MTIRTPDRTIEPTADRRSIEKWWKHPNKPFSPYGDDPSRHITVTVFEVSHNKYRKRYEAELYVQGYDGLFTQRVMGVGVALALDTTIASEPAARYSAKRMAAFAAESYTKLVERVEAGDPIVARLMAGDRTDKTEAAA